MFFSKPPQWYSGGRASEVCMCKKDYNICRQGGLVVSVSTSHAAGSYQRTS